MEFWLLAGSLAALAAAEDGCNSLTALVDVEGDCSCGARSSHRAKPRVICSLRIIAARQQDSSRQKVAAGGRVLLIQLLLVCYGLHTYMIRTSYALKDTKYIIKTAIITLYHVIYNWGSAAAA